MFRLKKHKKLQRFCCFGLKKDFALGQKKNGKDTQSVFEFSKKVVAVFMNKSNMEFLAKPKIRMFGFLLNYGILTLKLLVAKNTN